MDMYYNIHFNILRENLLDKFVLKTFYMIDQVKMNKLRRKKVHYRRFRKRFDENLSKQYII